MAQDFVIRCTPDRAGETVEWDAGSFIVIEPYIVRDDSGEIEYYPDINCAVAFAMAYQDASKYATYTVERA